MISFEQQVMEYLINNDFEFVDNTTSPDMPDFSITFQSGLFQLEVKEKRQEVKLSNWPTVEISKDNIVIVDELTARRLMAWSPNAGVLFRDNLQQRYIFIDVVKLWLMPRKRANRKISDNSDSYKGKWILNGINGVVTKSLHTAMRAIMDYAERAPVALEQSRCLGTFAGEDVPVGGEVRTAMMKEYDYRSTR